MDEIFITIYVIFGFVLRLGIPIGLTIALGWFLRRLDARWREEAEQYKQVTYREVFIAPSIERCWDYNNCSQDLREGCLAYQYQESPCWEIFRLNGSIRNKCRQCAYREQALVAVAA